MNKKVIIPFVAVTLLIITFLLINTTITGNFLFEEKKETAKATKQITITRDELNLYMQEQKIVKDLPKTAKIGLQFYRFENGERVWEEKLLIQRGSVEKTDFNQEEVDISIILHSRNLQNLGNMCNMIKTANQNGDLSYETKIGKTSFLWKYKGMMGYRDCFGM